MAETLYMTVEDAAAWAGIGKHTMRDFVNSSDPPPMLLVGDGTRKTHYIQRAGLARYLERKQNHVERG